MKITIEIDSDAEMEKLSSLLETFKIQSINIARAVDSTPFFTKGNKKLDPHSLFGIWADHPRSLDEIREKAYLKGITGLSPL